MLLELKTIFGYLLIFAIVATVVSRFIPFHKTRQGPDSQDRRRYGIAEKYMIA